MCIFCFNTNGIMSLVVSTPIVTLPPCHCVTVVKALPLNWDSRWIFLELHIIHKYHTIHISLPIIFAHL